MILKRIVVGAFATNCYIVGSEITKEGMIIDPGNGAKQVLKMVKDEQLDIKLIAITHGHVDHIGALKEVKEATGAAIAIHVDEAQSLHRSPLGMLFSHSLSAPPSPDRLLKDGDIIDIGDLHFSVLHTPGHTPGGICLYGHGILFSGDTLFFYGIGRTDFAEGSQSQLMNGIRSKLMVLPDDTIVYPGHGPETTIGHERKDNPFLRG